MRIFQPTSTLLPQDAIQDMQFRGCINDDCYKHPYDQQNHIWVQFPIQVNPANSFVLIVGEDGIPVTGNFLDVFANYVVGTYKCGGSELPYSVFELTDLPVEYCYYLYFVLEEDVTKDAYYFASEMIKPVALAECEDYYTLKSDKNSACGCSDLYYGLPFSVTYGVPTLQMLNTITLWGSIKRKADVRKYELNASTNKKISTTTFEQWAINSDKLVPEWVMEKVQSIFDGKDFDFVSPTLTVTGFDHSDDDPFKSPNIPCVCFYEFSTNLEKEACVGGTFCASDGQIGGCTSICYENYNPLATYDDGSCFNTPCDTEVQIDIETSIPYWQNITNVLALPDGLYHFIPNFYYDSQCNCEIKEERASIDGVFTSGVGFTFRVEFGVIVNFTVSNPFWKWNPNDVNCKVTIRPISDDDWFGMLWDFDLSLNLNTVIYNWEYNVENFALPITGAIKICQ